MCLKCRDGLTFVCCKTVQMFICKPYRHNKFCSFYDPKISGANLTSAVVIHRYWQIIDQIWQTNWWFWLLTNLSILSIFWQSFAALRLWSSQPAPTVEAYRKQNPHNWIIEGSNIPHTRTHARRWAHYKYRSGFARLRISFIWFRVCVRLIISYFVSCHVLLLT